MSESHVTERRPIWREQWLSLVHEFSDRERQRLLWLNLGDGSEISSFDELSCQYFDDLGFSRGEDVLVAEGYLSAREAEATLPLHEAYRKYRRGTLSDGQVTDDPEWGHVVAAAKGVRSALLSLISEPKEVHALTKG